MTIVFTVGPAKKYATITSAWAQVIADEGATPFIDRTLLDVDEQDRDPTKEPPE